MSSAPYSLTRNEVDDLVFSLSPRLYVETVEARSLFPWQADVLDDPSQFIAIDGARQGGKSTVVVKPAAHSARFFPGSLTVILASTEKQAVEDIEKFKTFISFDKDYPEIERSSDELVKLSNGSRVIVVPATEKSARGFSEYAQGPRLVIIDEASRVEEGVFTSAVLPMLTDSPDAVLMMISTPNGRKGFFYDSMLDPAFSRYHIRAPWDVIDIKWQLVPAEGEESWRKACTSRGIKGYYSPRHKRQEQQELFLRRMGPRKYRQEFLGEFIEPEDQVFTYDEIDRLIHKGAPVKALPEAQLKAAPVKALQFTK